MTRNVFKQLLPNPKPIRFLVKPNSRAKKVRAAAKVAEHILNNDLTLRSICDFSMAQYILDRQYHEHFMSNIEEALVPIIRRHQPEPGRRTCSI
jgi:hypothetical protein